MPLDGTLEKSNVLKPALEVDSALTGAANEDTLETLEASLRTDLRTAELMSAFARLVKRDGFCLVLRIGRRLFFFRDPSEEEKGREREKIRVEGTKKILSSLYIPHNRGIPFLHFLSFARTNVHVNTHKERARARAREREGIKKKDKLRERERRRL